METSSQLQKRKLDDNNDVMIKSETKIQRQTEYLFYDESKLYYEMIFEESKLYFDDNEDYLVDLEFDLYHQPFSTSLISDYFFKLHKNKYVCVKKINYFYNGIFWKKCDKKNCPLFHFFNDQFHNELLKYVFLKMEKLKSKLGLGKDQLVKKEIDKVYQLLKKVQNLRNFSTIQNHLRHIKMKCINDDIEFDSHPYLIAFTNGIYDLQRRELVEPKYDYYISKTTNYDYVESTVEQLMVLNNFMKAIFPNEANRTDFLIFLSTGLCGIQLQTFHIALGTGWNGKTSLISLMATTLGDYAILVPNYASSRDRQIRGLDNIRFVIYREPDCRKKMKSSLLKEMFENRLELDHNIKTKASVIMECNLFPAFHKTDKAWVEERLRIHNFDTKFVPHYEIKNEMTYHRICDNRYNSPEFEDEFKCVLFNYLLPYLVMYFENNNLLFDMPHDCVETKNRCISKI